MRLYLVRHGAVAAPQPGMFYGGTEVPLSAAGEAEARAAAELLAGENIDQVVCSSLGRARFGAEAVRTTCGLESVVVLDGFREIDRGRWLGLCPEEVRERWPGDLEAHEADPESWEGHGGESLGRLRDRVLATRDAWLATIAATARVCVVSHLWPTKAMLADVLGWGLERWPELEVPTGSVSCIAGDEVLWRGRRP